MSDQVVFGAKKTTEDIEGHYIMIDLPTEQNKPKYVRTKQQSFRTHKVKTDKPENINRQIHNFLKVTIITDYFNTPLPATDRTTRQKISKDIK